MKPKIMRAWDRGRNKVAYVYRDPETGRTKIGEEKFDWFFYVLRRDFEKHKSFFLRLEEQNYIRKFQHEETYTRVYVDREHNSDLFTRNMEYCWEYKDKVLNTVLSKLSLVGIRHFEADLSVYQRWIVSEKIEFDHEVKVLFLDIETDDSRMKGQPVPGEFQILSCAFIDGATGKEGYLVAEDWGLEHEFKLLEKMLKVMNGYDVFVSWNGSNFDIPYIKARAALHNLNIIDWRKKFPQDHLWWYKKLGPQLASYSLDAVSNFVLGVGKVEHSQKIFQMFNDNRELLKEYNVTDVRRIYGIENKTHFLEAGRMVNCIGMCPCDDIYISRKIDMMVLQQAFEDGHFHFKSKERGVENKFDDDEQFIGAFVVDPELGLHRNVKVIDFKSLYPNTIKTFNISPDTLVTEDIELDIDPDKIITAPSGHRFRKDFVGIMPKVITKMADLRNFYKAKMKDVQPGTVEHKTYDRLQYVYKYFGLSFYGVMGLKTSRFYDTRVAESVTLGGQFFTKTILAYLGKLNIKVFYGDTDSLFFEMEDDRKIEVLLRNIQKICAYYAIKQFGCDECTVEMDYDKGFYKWLIVSKKRYAGVLSYLDGRYLEGVKLYVAGLEMKRTDQCQIVRKKQEELLNLLLNKDADVTIGEVRKFLDDLKKYIFGDTVDIEGITFGQKITKPLEEYEGRNMHKMVAEQMMRDNKEVWVGDKISYYIESLDSEGKPVPMPTYRFKGKFAKSYYWNQKIFPPMKRIIEVVFPQINWSTYEIQGSKSKNVTMGNMSLW